MKEKIKDVNALLLAGEGENISVDAHKSPVLCGYIPQYIVDAMNEIFADDEWGFEEISNEIIPCEKPGSAIAVAKVSVWLGSRDSSFHPSGWGQARVVYGDIGDAHKGAQTDAIKKALSYFSIGNRAYRGLLKPPQETNQRPQATPPQAAKRQSVIAEQQIAAIRNLCQRLERPAPADLDALSEEERRSIIAALTDEQKKSRQAAAADQPTAITHEQVEALAKSHYPQSTFKEVAGHFLKIKMPPSGLNPMQRQLLYRKMLSVAESKKQAAS